MRKRKLSKSIKQHLLSVIILPAMLFVLAVFPTVVGAQETQATLSIPTLAISAPITEINIRQFPDNSITWDATNLGMNIGHLEGTAWLDTPGNIVLGGHSELEQRTPGIFYTLDQIQIGDAILLSNATETRQYTVTQVYQVAYTDLSPVYPASSERLTLITCDTGSYNTATGTYSERIIVIAERVA